VPVVPKNHCSKSFITPWKERGFKLNVQIAPDDLLSGLV
jgi:hypothetical protein